jgi:hypothetical protein
MLKGDAHIETREHDYRMSKTDEKGKEVVNQFVHIHIDKTMGEIMTRIPKGEFKKYFHNWNMRDSQNYSVVEDLSQTPCVMLSLEALQRCPSQRKVLLSALGYTKTCNMGMIMFYMTNFKPHLPYLVQLTLTICGLFLPHQPRW